MKKERQLSVGFSSMRSALEAYQKYGRLVFVAETVKNSFEEIAGKHFSNACVLYNTIDSSAIKSKAKENNPKAVFSKDEFNIVSVGRIIDAKGFDRLAHVQKQLRNSGYHTHVYILGAGPDMEKISSYIEEQGISDVFTFLGFHKNPYPFVAGADLFVCSSKREGFSTAVTEALVLGIPVVSTNCSGTYELLGKNGLKLVKNLPSYLKNKKVIKQMEKDCALFNRGKDFRGFIEYHRERNSSMERLYQFLKK